MQTNERKDGVRSLTLRRSWPRINSPSGGSSGSAGGTSQPQAPDWEHFWDELDERVNGSSGWTYWLIFWLFIGFVSVQLCWQEKLLELQRKILVRLGDVRKGVQDLGDPY